MANDIDKDGVIEYDKPVTEDMIGQMFHNSRILAATHNKPVRFTVSRTADVLDEHYNKHHVTIDVKVTIPPNVPLDPIMRKCFEEYHEKIEEVREAYKKPDGKARGDLHIASSPTHNSQRIH